MVWLFIINLFVDKLRFLGIYQILYLDTNKINLTKSLDIKDENGNFIGELRSACYSPHFKKVIGIAMINEPYCKASMAGKLEIEGNSFTVKVCDLPFI